MTPTHIYLSREAPDGAIDLHLTKPHRTSTPTGRIWYSHGEIGIVVRCVQETAKDMLSLLMGLQFVPAPGRCLSITKDGAVDVTDELPEHRLGY